MFVWRWTNYHGATLGGLTVGGSKLRRKGTSRCCSTRRTSGRSTAIAARGPTPIRTAAHAAAAEVEAAILDAGPGRVAAFIAEPIVASVGGAIRPQADYLPQVREICDRHGVLLILDEVVTGFGRTGRRFAADHWGVVPDLLVMGKGVSGGYAPLGAVAARQHVVRLREPGRRVRAHLHVRRPSGLHGRRARRARDLGAGAAHRAGC